MTCCQCNKANAEVKLIKLFAILSLSPSRFHFFLCEPGFLAVFLMRVFSVSVIVGVFLGGLTVVLASNGSPTKHEKVHLQTV